MSKTNVPLRQSRNLSEELFEAYLNFAGIADVRYEEGHPGKTTHPDYSFTYDGQTYFVEVKEIDEPNEMPAGIFKRNLTRKIKEKINVASKQFRQYQEFPCILALYSLNPLVDINSQLTMKSAMFGTIGLEVAVGPDCDNDALRPVFGSGGKFFNFHKGKSQNTTISGILSLNPLSYDVVDEAVRSRALPEEALKGAIKVRGNLIIPTVTFWENPFARHRIDNRLFSQTFDQRWTGVGGEYIRTFAGPCARLAAGREGISL